MIRKLLFLVVFLAGCSTTPSFNHETNEVSCSDENGKQITNITGYKADYVFQLASAFYNTETEEREIRISSNIIDNVAPSTLEFIAYHECAHHQLNHIKTDGTPLPALWSDEQIHNEHSADCQAAQTYYEQHGQDQFFKMVNELDEDKFLAINNKRIARIKQCINAL